MTLLKQVLLALPPCIVKLLKNGRDKLVVRSPEKAGVDGSTPSLAAMFPSAYPWSLQSFAPALPVTIPTPADDRFPRPGNGDARLRVA
jgi:hypothetical protein